MTRRCSAGGVRRHASRGPPRGRHDGEAARRRPRRGGPRADGGEATTAEGRRGRIEATAAEGGTTTIARSRGGARPHSRRRRGGREPDRPKGTASRRRGGGRDSVMARVAVLVVAQDLRRTCAGALRRTSGHAGPAQDMYGGFMKLP